MYPYIELSTLLIFVNKTLLRKALSWLLKFSVIWISFPFNLVIENFFFPTNAEDLLGKDQIIFFFSLCQVMGSEENRYVSNSVIYWQVKQVGRSTE